MRSSALTLALASLTSGSLAAYSLVDEYTSENIFSDFEFHAEADPSSGYVDYVDQETATDMGMVSTNNSIIYIGVDHNNVVTDGGRKSVRIKSKKTWDDGLIIADIKHMPNAICGSWPAFWTVGPDWPNGGEIDIIEGINDQDFDNVAFHTGPNCTVKDSNNFTGELNGSVCGGDDNADGGCSIASTDEETYGVAFNEIGGGVFATEINSEAVSVWFFPRDSIPGDIASGKPDPNNWAKPFAQFQGDCDIPSKVKQQDITINTNFCGSWASREWSNSPNCAAKADTCNDYVKNNPEAFVDAYWLFNYVHVYQES